MNLNAQEIRILLADDHPIFRDGLKRLLEAEPGFKVIGEASNIRACTTDHLKGNNRQFYGSYFKAVDGYSPWF